ncbi:MAG TPA: ankyrin repeat domain-containing protein [Tepidisphaeraceae bacterium]|jgi:hypothetical protein
METSTSGRQTRFTESPNGSRILAIVAIVLTATLWALALALPVWETRSETGEWKIVEGVLPALIGWLGVLALCPAWFANLLLLPLCFTLFKGRRAGFWISIVAFTIAASAYMMPAIYGDNSEAAIVGRRIGFYLWLGSFLVMVLAHALQAHRADRARTPVRVVAIAGIVLLAAVMEHAFRVGVTPLEATLKDPNDVAAFTTALSRHPSQAEKDAALPWVMLTDVSHVQGAIIRTQRLEQLIAAGANVNQPDRYGTTPLMQAVRTRGAESAVRLLIRADANVNARDDRGKTVLDIAEEADCSPECRQVLTDAGAWKSGQSNRR